MSDMKNVKVCSMCGIKADVSLMYPSLFGYVCQGCIDEYKHLNKC